MTDQTPGTTEPVGGQPAPITPPAGQSGGLNISAGGGVTAGGDIVGGDKNTTSTGSPGNGTGPRLSPRPAGPSAGEVFAKSSWANGLFYLFAFVVIVGMLGFFAGSLDLVTLALIIVAGIVAVPVLGALQLKQDKRLSDKSFLSLVKMVFAQLPLIGGLVKK